MDSEFCEVQRIAFPPPGVGLAPTPTTALAFDNFTELLWTGNDYGRVTSFGGPALTQYSSYKAQSAGPVNAFLFNDKAVISLGPRSVHVAARGGYTLAHYEDARLQNLKCMSYTSLGNSEILIGGSQRGLVSFSVDRGEVVKQIDFDHETRFIRRNARNIFCGTAQGNVVILDPRSLDVVHTIQAYTGGINDMDASGDYLVTAGYTHRSQFATYLIDQLVRVYDARYISTSATTTTAISLSTPSGPFPLRNPVAFPAGAAFCRMHPKMSTTVVVASPTGQFQMLDVVNPNSTTILRHANTSSYLSQFELAPSGDAIAMSDQACEVQLWGRPNTIRFNEHSTPIELASPPPILKHNWSENISFSSVGIPYYTKPLASATGWGRMTFDTRRRPPRMEPDTTSKTSEPARNLKNASRTIRNQQFPIVDLDKNSNFKGPKFLSDRTRHDETPDFQSLWNHKAIDSRSFEPPPMYNSQVIKYSKYGVDDYNFAFYNTTPHSGLEIHVQNSYANSLLQLYKYIPGLRNHAMHHVADFCSKENCMLCELGFLFDMMEKANGKNCHATNFSRSLGLAAQATNTTDVIDIPQSTATGKKRQAPAIMLQKLNKFLFDTILIEGKVKDQRPNAIDESLATSFISNIKCVVCGGEENERQSSLTVQDMAYSPHAKGKAFPTFSTVVKYSFDLTGQTRGWCDKCHRYQNLTTKKKIIRLPKVLMLNAALNSPNAKSHWTERNWLPEEIGVLLHEGSMFCYQGEDLSALIARGHHRPIVYELVGLVAEIQGAGKDGAGHLVSLIDVSKSRSKKGRPHDKSGKWHLFNDFLVHPVTKEEALNFAPTWKLPVALCYQAKSPLYNVIDDSWKDRLDTRVLFTDVSINNYAKDKPLCKILTPNEVPTPGTHIGIDTEFVILEEQKVQIKPDNTMEILRPSRSALARVSILHGERGDNEGVTFIDDYVPVKEEVANFLTQFSGIEPGDLDPATSKYALTPFKLVYRKIWLLLNLGCIFVGHGLASDFRVLNIYIPKAQVIDTVEIFALKAGEGGRRVSLRFLAWKLLNIRIQTGNHDSNEDASASLKIWRKSEEFIDAGILQSMINEIFVAGRATNFKAPWESSAKQTKSVGVSTAGGVNAAHLAAALTNRTSTPPGMKDITLGLGNITFGNQISSPGPARFQNTEG